MNLEFLKQITFVRTSFFFKPTSVSPPELPPFAGSALRGAFGHAFRKRLCWFARQQNNPCELAGECTHPDDCEYFRLFERSHQNNTAGPNVVKPYILEPPIPAELEAISSAKTPVTLPFYQLPGTPAAIGNDTPLAVPGGFSVGFTLLGQAASLLPSVVDLLRLSPLLIGPHRFILDRVEEPVTAHLGSPPVVTASRLRIGLLTPCRLRASSKEGGDYRFDARDFAGQFWQASLIRAMRVRDQFCSDGERLPWIDFPDGILPHITRTRLYRYHYERLSNRQQKKMDFDGMIGSIWFEGEGLKQLAPLVEAAEVLHIGQKATFGLGLVRGEWL